MLNIVVKKTFINLSEICQRTESYYISKAISALRNSQCKAGSLFLGENGAHKDLGICANIIQKDAKYWLKKTFYM